MFSNHGKFFLKQRDLKEPCPEDEHKGCLLMSSKPYIPLEKHIHRNNLALNTKTFATYNILYTSSELSFDSATSYDGFISMFCTLVPLQHPYTRHCCVPIMPFKV